eukprot:symbB.v1.2.001990.t1/scaffold53.1/size378684/11
MDLDEWEDEGPLEYTDQDGGEVEEVYEEEEEGESEEHTDDEIEEVRDIREDEDQDSMVSSVSNEGDDSDEDELPEMKRDVAQVFPEEQWGRLVLRFQRLLLSCLLPLLLALLLLFAAFRMARF